MLNGVGVLKSTSHIMALCSLLGELTQGELYSAIKKEKEQTVAGDSTHFSGEMHFYELVEDTKDGIWLVQVSGHLSAVNRDTTLYDLSF